MSRKGAFLTAFIGLSLVLGGPARVARAACGGDGAPSAEARAANDRGLELVQKNDFAGALREFQAAYDDCPSYVILYNIGKMARLTQDFARSLKAYQRYLTDGAPDIDADRRAEVEREIASLSSLVGYVSIEAPEGAKVSVDGVSLGTAPLQERVALNPGAHRFEAVAADKKASQDATIKAGDSAGVKLAFGATGPGEGPETGAGYTFPSGVVTLTWVAASAFAWTAIISGSVAIATSDDLEDDTYLGPDRAPAEGSAIADKSERIKALATVTDVFIVAAAITGAAAITFSIVDAVGDSDPEDPPANDAPVKTVDLEIGPSTIAIRGRF